MGINAPKQINQPAQGNLSGFFIAQRKAFMSSTQHSVEAITIGASQKLTVGGGAAAAVTGAAEKAGVVEFVTGTGSLDVAGICALGGLFLAFVGYFTSLYFQWRRDRRESVESEMRRKRLFGVE